MKKLNFYELFYLFIFGSYAGYIIEFLWTFLKKGVLINHSALVIGPFNFAYGICIVVFTILLYKYRNCSYSKVFLLSFIGGSILEYVMSLGMELVLGFSAWDYSQKFLNLNGRIALVYSIFWGLLGVLWIKILYPPIMNFVEKINKYISKKVAIIFLILLIFDGLFTLSCMSRAREFDKGISPQNNYERFLDNTFNSAYLKNMFNNTWEQK